MINNKKICPVFEIKDENGKIISTENLKNKTFILYFYPKGIYYFLKKKFLNYKR